MSESQPTSRASSQSQHVVIIGAGFVGVATAMWLQRHGHRVTLIDPKPFAQGAYYGNACTMATYANIPVATPSIIKQVPKLIFDPLSPLSIRWGYLPKLAPWLVRFLLASGTHTVASIAEQLGVILAQAGPAFVPLWDTLKAHDLLCHNGVLYLYGQQQGLKKAKPDIELRRRNGIAVQTLTTAEIAELEPNLAHKYAGGLLFNDGYHIRNPLQLLQLMGDALVQHSEPQTRGNIKIAKALTISRINANECQVITDQGVITGNKVVIAAGAWSKPLAAQVGDHLPLDTEQGYHVMFTGAQDLVSRPVGWADAGFYMVPMDTALRAAGTVEFGGVDNPANPNRVKLISDTVKSLLPQLGDYDSQWTGFRPSMPDSKPVIGSSSQDKDIYYAFGHGHLGVTLSALTGKIIADLISGQEPEVDLTPFSPSRF